MPARTRPVEKFAKAVAKCSAEVCISASLKDPNESLRTQASVYGKCIAADYNGVYKDKCLTEFTKLKDCYTVWSFLAYLYLRSRMQAALKRK